MNKKTIATLSTATLFSMIPMVSSAAIVSLTGDVSNTTDVRPDQTLGGGTTAAANIEAQLLALTNDTFIYDPLNPTATVPLLDGVGNYFHGSDGSGGVPDSNPDIIAFDFDSTYDTIFIDLWGRDTNANVELRDDDFNVELYLGGVLQETITGNSIPGSNYLRVTAIAGTEADSIRIVDNTDPANSFSLTEIRVNGTLVPEPSSTALLGLGGLALILRRKK